MSKHKTKEEWISLFKMYEKGNLCWEDYFEKHVHTYKSHSTAKRRRSRSHKARVKHAQIRFLNKYKEWKLLDNMFMSKKETRGRKPKRDIDGFVKNLTREQLEEIARIHISRNERDKKKDSSPYKSFTIKEKAFILSVHRTTLYKTPKERKYKFDIYKEEIINSFYENKSIYGRRRLSIYLKQKYLIVIDDRTLGRYLSRYNLLTETRKARRKSESKNISVKYVDLVKRNFNPKKDNIVATDVSYIPANVDQNHIYLSVAISHKTKLIESWKLSQTNDNDLVISTIKGLKRKKSFILHSDHGSQYSSKYVLDSLSQIPFESSMSRVGNSLDNREVEYFFGCLKGEYLNRINTYKMNIEEIKKHIRWYITWYNENRIQKRLQWKTPAQASAYAI